MRSLLQHRNQPPDRGTLRTCRSSIPRSSPSRPPPTTTASSSTVTEADLKGKWSVFVFYPADFTFVCPTELGDLAEQYAEFKKLGVEIYGVSTDTHFAHKAWHDTSDTIKKIQYPLVGDPTATLARNFEVLIEEEGLALRGTFVINPGRQDQGARSP